MTKKQAILQNKIKAVYCDCSVSYPLVFVSEWKGNGKSTKENGEFELELTVPKKLLGPPKKSKKALDKKESEPKDGNKYWFKCTHCSQVQLIDEWKIEELTEPDFKAVKKESCRPYTPKSTFEIGEIIFHKALNATGLVKSKVTTSGGMSAIVVDFGELGTKQLLEGLKK